MREKFFGLRVQSKADMDQMEASLGALLGRKEKRCAFMRSQDYQRLRLCALYSRGDPPVSVYGEGFQIYLDRDKNVSIFLLSSTVEQEEGGLGKRPPPDVDD
jgi:hypothetical protein